MSGPGSKTKCNGNILVQKQK